jgi:hypothetical protein
VLVYALVKENAKCLAENVHKSQKWAKS